MSFSPSAREPTEPSINSNKKVEVRLSRRRGNVLWECVLDPMCVLDPWFRGMLALLHVVPTMCSPVLLLYLSGRYQAQVTTLSPWMHDARHGRQGHRHGCRRCC